jgi:hypothetical protein
MQAFDAWTMRLPLLCGRKEKCRPTSTGYGHQPPNHFLANLKDGIRYVRMMVGHAPRVHHRVQETWI